MDARRSAAATTTAGAGAVVMRRYSWMAIGAEPKQTDL